MFTTIVVVEVVVVVVVIIIIIQHFRSRWKQVHVCSRGCVVIIIIVVMNVTHCIRCKYTITIVSNVVVNMMMMMIHKVYIVHRHLLLWHNSSGR